VTALELTGLGQDRVSIVKGGHAMVTGNAHALVRSRVLLVPPLSGGDRLTVGWLNGLSGGVPREKKMLKGLLPRVIYPQV